MLILQQWQGILRWVLTSVGGYLVTKGIVSADNWSTLTPLIMTAVGGLISLGSAAWTIHSNQAKVIKSTATSLTAAGK